MNPWLVWFVASIALVVVAVVGGTMWVVPVAYVIGLVVGYAAGRDDRCVPPRPSTDQPYYVCPLCWRRSFHPEDVANEYCSCCGSADGMLPKECAHRRALRA